MIEELPPYPAYKDSGVPWLGPVPAHWEMVPLRRMASGFKNGTSAEQISSGSTAFPVSRIETISTGAINYDKVGFIREENVDPRFWLQPNDILLSHINSFEMVGNCAQFLGERPLLHGMNLIRIRPKNRAVGAFMFRFMKSAAFRYEMRALCKPAINQVSVTTTAIKGIHMPLPPLPEQVAIVRFLDYMDRRIRRSIRAKQKLIKLLEEYRQALIHQAVAGKIDVRTGQPYPAYKDSGVPWLGHVPEHWEVMPVKRALRPQSCGNVAIKNTAAATPLNGYAPAFSASGQDVWLPRASHSGSALVLSAVGARCGKTFRADGEWGVVANTHILWPRAAQNRDYWWYVTNNEAWWDKAGAAQPFVRVSATLERSWVIPPLPEQTAIVEYLDAQTAKLDTAIAAARREIELLREYRERLIADVVTGKVDVREVAAQLPEEPPEEEAGTEEEEPVAEELATADSQEEANGEE